LTVCIGTSPYFRHEHLYEKIERNLIRSDDFNDIVTMERLLLGLRVLLCTISMLSNMKMGNFSRLVPLQTVIFDEASQIEIGDYFPMLVHFRSTLRKLVFIGDHKQCKSDNLLPSP
jgi:regulator of nonsense transcripts 1